MKTVFVWLVLALIIIGPGVVLSGSGGGFAAVSDETPAKTESARADKIDSDWGGHAKIRGGFSRPSADSLFGLAGGGTCLDGSAEGRLKSELYFGEFSKFETHYELIWSGGETRENIRELERMFPALTGEFFIRNRIPNDDRRLFDLTSVISDKDDYVLYHRIDRLVLTLKPDWGVVRIGRQAATWGNGMLFNPMDLFNPFPPTDIERDYKIGDDMVSVQMPLLDSGSLQVLYVPRRNPETSDVSSNYSSFAAKYHFFSGMTELDVMAARHYSDYVLGAGIVGYIGEAAWRVDLTWTLLDSESPSDDFFSLAANIDYSWIWLDKNFYGFMEFFYSGIGEKDYEKALENLDVIERIDRGELFTLGKTYLAGSVRVELHPLFNFFLNSINNLQDPSGVIQPRATYDIGQNTQILIGGNFFWGPRDSEFGGVVIPGTEFTTRGADSVYAWFSYYF